MNEIKIIKTDKPYCKPFSFVVVKGDIRASFKTLKEAQECAKKEMPHLWMGCNGYTVWDDREYEDD